MSDQVKLGDVFYKADHADDRQVCENCDGDGEVEAAVSVTVDRGTKWQRTMECLPGSIECDCCNGKGFLEPEDV